VSGVTAVSSRIADDRALSYDDGFPVHKVAASNVLEDRFRLPYPLCSPALFALTSQLARDVDVVLAHTHTFMTTVAAARAARKHRKPFVLVQNNPYIEYRFPLDLVQKTADATIARYTIGAADRLVAVHTSVGGTVELRAPLAQHSGGLIMRTVPEIPIPADSMVRLNPDTSHLLITGAGPMHDGKDIMLRLTFADAGTITVIALVTDPESGGSSYFLN